MVRERRALAKASRLAVLVDGAKEGVVLPHECGGREEGGWRDMLAPRPGEQACADAEHQGSAIESVALGIE